jgi:dTDP-4-amino-4,6-dideoxygalactose transaminase
MAVPLLDLKAQYRPLRTPLLEAMTRVADSQVFVMGAEVQALEDELAAALDAKHAISVSSGTDALLLALMALGVKPGDEVITPSFSFFATAGCVARLGATPVFVDIDPETFSADPSAIARAINSKTKAIIPVHLFGLIGDIEAIVSVAQKAGIAVIEDAAQAIGARRNGKQAGTFGDVGCMSFFPSKNLGAFGDGGLVVVNDDTLAREMRLLRNHGAEPKYHHARIGGNFRLDAIQAAVLRVKLPHLADWTEARRRNAERYRQLFSSAGIEDVVLPIEPPGCFHIYNQFVIRVPRRDELKRYLTDRGIGTEIYYPVPFHRQECFRYLDAALDGFPVSDSAAETSLALPIYGELTAAQQEEVVSAIADYSHGHRRTMATRTTK